MSAYDDDYEPRSRRARDRYPVQPGPPPSQLGGDFPERPRQQRSYGSRGGSVEDLPPPPMGDALNDNRRPSAMKREGSRSRASHLRPEFPDEASNAPDLERKNRRKDRAFREKRDGYESDEGESLRKNRPRRGEEDEYEPRRRGNDRSRDSRDDRSYGGGPPSAGMPPDAPPGAIPVGAIPVDDGPPPGATPVDQAPRQRPRDNDRRRGYDDDPAPRRRDRDDYDERPRRRRDDYDDYDDKPSRRRSERPVEYGSAPIPARRNTDAGRRGGGRRRDDYDDRDDRDDHSSRRHRSQEDRDRRRRPDYNHDDRYYGSDRDRGKGREDYGRDDRDRRRYDDDYDDYDRRDSRRDDRRGDRDRRRGPPKQMMIGKYDVGPMMEAGQKHYKTVAPIVTPLIMNAAKKYLAGAR